VALALAACHDVTQEPRPADLVFASFASPNIPTPNDLALAALNVRSPLVNSCGTVLDACANPPNAQAQLLCTFRAAGGFPSDQEVPITIPLSALRLDTATNSYVPAAAPAIDLATVTAATVTTTAAARAGDEVRRQVDRHVAEPDDGRAGAGVGRRDPATVPALLGLLRDAAART
jgi:hypothetical protein